jgi:hypothetical protein
MKSILMSVLGLVLVAGCVRSPVDETVKFVAMQHAVKVNNDNLLKLELGLNKTQVLDIMGKPEKSEAYAWGSIYLYRTAISRDVYTPVDADFTPVVFNEKGDLIGWGRNFYESQVQKYELKVKKE